MEHLAICDLIYPQATPGCRGSALAPGGHAHSTDGLGHIHVHVHVRTCALARRAGEHARVCMCTWVYMHVYGCAHTRLYEMTPPPVWQAGSAPGSWCGLL